MPKRTIYEFDNNIQEVVGSPGWLDITNAAQAVSDAGEVASVPMTNQNNQMVQYAVSTVEMNTRWGLIGEGLQQTVIHAIDTSAHTFMTTSASQVGIGWILADLMIQGVDNARNQGNNVYDLVHVHLADSLGSADGSPQLPAFTDAFVSADSPIVDAWWSTVNVWLWGAQRSCLWFSGRGENFSHTVVAHHSRNAGIWQAGGFDHKLFNPRTHATGGAALRLSGAECEVVGGKGYFAGYNKEGNGTTGELSGERGAGLWIDKDDFLTGHTINGFAIQDTAGPGIVDNGSGNKINLKMQHCRQGLSNNTIESHLNGQTAGSADAAFEIIRSGAWGGRNNRYDLILGRPSAPRIDPTDDVWAVRYRGNPERISGFLHTEGSAEFSGGGYVHTSSGTLTDSPHWTVF